MQACTFCTGEYRRIFDAHTHITEKLPFALFMPLYAAILHNQKCEAVKVHFMLTFYSFGCANSGVFDYLRALIRAKCK